MTEFRYPKGQHPNSRNGFNKEGNKININPAKKGEHRSLNTQFKSGRVVSLEIKSKISQANKGRKMPPRTKEHLEKLSVANSGERNHFWKGGITAQEYPKEFSHRLREQVRRRDSYRCRECGISQLQNGKKLCVHHIDYNKKNCSEENLISLCAKCHIKTNFGREDWQKYFIDNKKTIISPLLYLPSLSDLIDRLSISVLKLMRIKDYQEEYIKEIKDITHDIDIIIKEKKINLSANIIFSSLIIALVNDTIWRNETIARQGGTEQDKLLKFTHSLNGIRNNFKNSISFEVGDRKDFKTDCLASEFRTKEFVRDHGDWSGVLEVGSIR